MWATAEAAKMDPRCTMGLRITLFVAALLLSGAASHKSQAYFNETADLPCRFTNSRNISLGELVIFWQDHQNLVLYESYLGNEKPDNVDAKYMGRTSFDQDNWTLRLHNVQIKDKGSYQCFIHHKGPRGFVPLFQMTSELSVFANFSEPEISPLSNITRQSGINLTCSSSQGYPQPIRISFWLKTKNSTVEHDGVMEILQDNDTELYNVSTSLSVPFPDDTSNVTIVCVIYMDSRETLFFSPPFNTVLPDPSPVIDQRHFVAIALVLLTGFALVFLLIKWMMKKKKKKKQQTTSSREAINTESEETKEREKSHVPEQDDEEAPCVLHCSKIPSGNRNATHF
ncbi:T-lymphocyte activation antigen CD86 isoform X2 [Sciurus carolinensis]|uniref:T-lymphocyte activation antigen CD86 isoform X2 n=1 Tax=Sciurus carolinensis TaxID=30640 RepID=UPI001FB35E33|nr:T-lymphocyte activation antigen CD86 isoform X2 [Sciurus carolinensis]